MDFPGKSLSIRAKQRLLGGRGYSWDEDNDIWTAGGGVRDKEGMRERERERGGDIFQRSFGIVLTFFVLEDVRVLLVNDDATVAGFSGTEKQRSLLFKLLDSISLVGIRTLSLPVLRFLFFFFSFLFLERKARCFRISLLVKTVLAVS